MNDPDLTDTPPRGTSGILAWLATAAICAFGTIFFVASAPTSRIHLRDPNALFKSWVELSRDLSFIGVQFVSLVGLIAAIVCGTPTGRRMLIPGSGLPNGVLRWGILLSYLAPWTTVLLLWLRR